MGSRLSTKAKLDSMNPNFGFGGCGGGGMGDGSRFLDVSGGFNVGFTPPGYGYQAAVPVQFT